MTEDNGLDNHLPISKEGLLAAIETAIEIIKSGETEFSIEYLGMLHANIENDTCTHYPSVVRRKER